MSATKHLDDLDDGIDMARIASAGALHALVNSARNEIKAAEAEHAALKLKHAELTKAHAALEDEHAQLKRAQSVKGPTIIDNRSPADDDTLLGNY